MAFSLTKNLVENLRNNGLRYLIKYDHRPGFKICVLGAQNLKQKGFSFTRGILMNGNRIIPPVRGRGDNRDGFEFLTSKFDYQNACLLSPAWNDGFQVFYNNQGILFCIEINSSGCVYMNITQLLTLYSKCTR